MRKVKCYACGKSYDYDEDGFCPNCGGFNQPRHGSAISADGSVVRVDGLNERGHEGSFLHREFHEENRERRAMGLEQEVRRTVQSAVSAARKSAGAAGRSASGRGKKESPLRVAAWIIGAIVAANILLSLVQTLFWSF